MKVEIKHFPYFIVKPIPKCRETGQVFLLPGVLVGKGFVTFYLWRKMLTVNFNTTMIYDGE